MVVRDHKLDACKAPLAQPHCGIIQTGNKSLSTAPDRDRSPQDTPRPLWPSQPRDAGGERGR